MKDMKRLRHQESHVRLASLRALLVNLLCALAITQDGVCDGTLSIIFELPPVPGPGQGDGGPEYVESGMRFMPRYLGSAISQGVLRYHGPYFGFPDNGSTYFGGVDNLTNTLVFGRVDGGLFSLVSVELADYNTVFPGPGTVEFVGHRSDGSIVTQDFLLQRLIVDGRPAFEAFSFGPEFSDLARVEVPSHYWWMDNLVVLIPEPSSLVLLAGGGLVAVVCALRTRRRA